MSSDGSTGSPHAARPGEQALASAGLLWALAKAMRPHQWTKNLLVFAALVFAQRLGDAGDRMFGTG